MLQTENRFRESIFILLIFIYIMEYELVGLVQSSFLDRIIKLGSLSLLLLLFPIIRGGNHKSPEVKKILYIYFGFFLIMFISSLLNPSMEAYIMFFKYFMMFLVLLILLYYLHPSYFSEGIIKFPIAIGIVLSVHSILSWLLLYYGVEIDYTYVTNERAGRYLAPHNSFWGDMTYAGYRISRAWGFFITPDKYGNFLQYPAFISLGYYILTKKLTYLIASILCFLTLFLTFSTAAILSSAAVIIISIVIKYLSRIKQLRKSMIIITALGLLSVSLVSVGMHSYIRDRFISEGGAIYSPIYYRAGNYETVFHFLNEQNLSRLKPDLGKPFGEGLNVTRSGDIYMSQYAVERWMNIAGLPILILFVFYFVHMYRNYIFPTFVGRNSGIEHYVALAYSAQTIMQLEHGAWWNPFYFYTTAILILLKIHHFEGKPQTISTAAGRMAIA